MRSTAGMIVGRRAVTCFAARAALCVACAVLFGCGGQKKDEAASTTVDRSAMIARSIAESQGYLDRYADTDDVSLTALAEDAAVEAVGADSTTLALLQLARVRMAQCYYDEAFTLLSLVLTENHRDEEIWGMLGDALLVRGDYRSADSCYHIMAGIDDGFESQLRLARRDELFGKFDDAIAGVDRAIAGAKTWASGRDLARAYAQLAAIFFSHGYLDAALQNIDLSLGNLPGVVPRLAMKADMLRVGGQMADAMEILTELPELSRNPIYLAKLARAYQDAGDGAAADSLVARAAEQYDELEVDYYSVVARPYVEFLLAFDIEPAKALKMAHSLSRHRRDIYAYELLAWAYYKNEQYDLAWSSISLALRRDATDPRVLYRAALIAKAADLDDKYEEFAERAKQVNPLCTAMYGNFGEKLE